MRLFIVEVVHKTPEEKLEITHHMTKPAAMDYISDICKRNLLESGDVLDVREQKEESIARGLVSSYKDENGKTVTSVSWEAGLCGQSHP